MKSAMCEPSEARVVKLQDSETVRFLELYAAERLLYDANCKEYKDRDLRFAAANRVSEAMAIPGFGPKGVISKFKNLRSSYCQELKKMAGSERSGDDVYVPKVIWFQTMDSFIRPFVQQRSTRSNLVCPTNSNSPVSFDEVYQQETLTNNFSEKMPSTTTAETGQHEEMKCTPKTTFKHKAPLEPSSTIEDISQGTRTGYMCGAIKKLKDNSDYAAPIPQDDSYDYFGKYISSMLRSIGPPTAMRLQEQITHLVTQAMCPPQ